MKIGILTHYNVINNGATLQMFALKSWLEEKGHDVFILTYKKNFDYSEEASKKYIPSFKNRLFIFKSYFLKGSPSLFFFKVKKHKIFNKFIKSHFSFVDYKSELDVVIVGSDEVFSLEVGCNKMMYGYGLNTNRVVSYAPSFGQTDIELINKRNCFELISNGLKSFSSLSVRDKYSQKVVRELINKECEIVCDPVILYDFSKVTCPVRPLKKKYILIYSYDKNMNSEEEVKSIKKYAKNRGLNIVSVGTYHKWCDKNINCNPVEWIEYFRNAEEVITDTFHGAILSMITQKKALFLRRSINSNKINSLIEEFELNKFLVDKIDDKCLERFKELVYDKDKIQELIKAKRAHSEAFLEKSLKNG